MITRIDLAEFVPPSASAETMLDTLAPVWDATRVERRIIDAPLAEVYDAAIRVDFLDAVRGNPLVKIVLAIRAGFELVLSAIRRRPSAVQPPPLTMRLVDLPHRGEWVLLGADPPNEIAFGAAGRFWAGETKWSVIDTTEFAAFRTPGFAKIACHLLFRATPDGRTAVTYEARTIAGDETVRRAFLRYWRFVSLGVGIVMRSLLRVIAVNVASASTGALRAQAHRRE